MTLHICVTSGMCTSEISYLSFDQGKQFIHSIAGTNLYKVKWKLLTKPWKKQIVQIFGITRQSDFPEYTPVT